MKDGHCTSVLRLTQEHIRQLGQTFGSDRKVSQSCRQYRHQSAKSVGDEAVDCYVSGSATAVAGDLYNEDMLLAGLQSAGMYFSRVLPQNITKECINVEHGLVLAWGEGRIDLLDDVRSTLTAWSGFAAVEYHSSAMGNLFMVTMICHIRHLTEILESSAGF